MSHCHSQDAAKTLQVSFELSHKQDFPSSRSDSLPQGQFGSDSILVRTLLDSLNHVLLVNFIDKYSVPLTFLVKLPKFQPRTQVAQRSR